ncbi:MAG: GNAT family N-acetyltransferase [Chloroflexota bacterium]|nr:GNAT family N-acetyltransferase [Chloroflexota bacterium]
MAVTLRVSGVLICNAGIRRKPENDWETDIGYKITPECRGQSYATEGAADLVTYGFNQRGCTGYHRGVSRRIGHQPRR